MLKKIFLSLIVLLLFSSLLLDQTSAKLPGEGATIIPPLKQLTINPGETVTEKIKLANPTNTTVEFYPVLMNFKAKGESGEPDFYPASVEIASHSLANWITYTQTKVVLTAEQDVEFEYKISVPINAEPGGHYGVVFFMNEPPNVESDESQVSLTTMIGTLHLVRVPGDIIEKAELKEFSTQKFFFKPPTDFIIRIENLGNVHFKPRGEIDIKNWRNKEVGDVKVNQKEGSILPDSIRKFNERWAPEYKYFFEIPIGRMTGNLNLRYGESNQELTGKVVFWIIPWWLIITLAIILLLIIYYLYKKIRRRKKKSKIKDDSRIIIR